jgi:hypothetical protein
MTTYLSNFSSAIHNNQLNRLNRTLSVKNAAGQFQTTDQFKNELNKMMVELFQNKLKPLLKLYRALPSTKIDVETYNFMLQKIQDDLETAFNSYSPNIQIDAYYSESPLTSAQGGTGLANPGTSGNVLTSDGNVWVSSAAGGVGVNQTWQDVTSSRVANTNYTNDTSKPIIVNIYRANSNTNGDLIVDGVTVATINPSSDPSSGSTISIVIPVGSVYKFTQTFNFWVELR